MNAFSRFGFLTTAITYLLIFAGGLVRVSSVSVGGSLQPVSTSFLRISIPSCSTSRSPG